MTEHPKVLVIAGPTASGKKAAALRLARSFGGEIVSADSRKVYRELDIGTAKPSAEAQREVPHHLIDVADPSDPFSVGDWVPQAAEAVRAILGRGRLPILSGGTGFYLKAFMEGLSDGIEPGPGVRERLERELSEQGPDAMHRRLAEVDPVRAAELHPNDTFRVLRALEVWETTGRPFSSVSDNPVTSGGEYRYRIIGITRNREVLYDRCNRRVDAMIDAGLEMEVRGLLDSDVSRTAQALDTVGYKEWFGFFDGELSLDETIELIKRNTRRYAKRQLTWFNARPGFDWFDLDTPGAADRLDDTVAAWLAADSP